MEQIVEEVQVCTHFEVPCLFRFILNGVADILVRDLIVLNLHITTSRLCLPLQFCLQNVAEHLDIKPSGTIAF